MRTPKEHQRCAALLALILLGAVLASAAHVNYAVTLPVAAGSITGTIVTDGTIGALATGNILSWTLTLTGGGNSYTLEGPLSGNNSVLTVYLGGLSTQNNGRIYYSFTGDNFFSISSNVGPQADAFCLGSPGVNCNYGSLSFLRVHGATISASSEPAQNTLIGSLAQTTPATPVPSTILLTLIGLTMTGCYFFRFSRSRRSLAGRDDARGPFLKPADGQK
jgi:hypothetical protein